MRGIAAIVLFVLLAASASAFVRIDDWQLPDAAFADYSIDTSVWLDIDDLESGDELKATFIIPELGVYASKGYFDPDSLNDAHIQQELSIPWDAEPGEYALQFTVRDQDGNAHTRYRFIDIE